MGLKMIKPRIATVDTRTVKPPAKARAQVYGTGEYSKWRESIVSRAGRRCEWIDGGERCSNAEPAQRLYADHVVELSDGGAPFDLANGQCLCGSHHAAKTAAARKSRNAGDHTIFFSSYPEWLRPSHIPLTIVCGPPASGKSTYVASHRLSSDLVIDLDVIASEISGDPLHAWNTSVLGLALRRRNSLLGSLSTNPKWRAAWFIVGEPRPDRREWWETKLAPRQVIVLETPEAVCLQRIASDPSRNIGRGATTGRHSLVARVREKAGRSPCYRVWGLSCPWSLAIDLAWKHLESFFC